MSAAWQRPTSYSPSYGETDSGFKIGGVTPPAILARFGTRRFAPLLAPKKAVQVAVISCQMRRRSKRAWLSGTATKRLLLPRKLYPSGTLWDVCRTWWGLAKDCCHCAVSVFAVHYFIHFFRFPFSFFRLNSQINYNIRGLSGKYPAIWNISRTVRVALL